MGILATFTIAFPMFDHIKADSFWPFTILAFSAIAFSFPFLGFTIGYWMSVRSNVEIGIRYGLRRRVILLNFYGQYVRLLPGRTLPNRLRAIGVGIGSSILFDLPGCLLRDLALVPEQQFLSASFQSKSR